MLLSLSLTEKNMGHRVLEITVQYAEDLNKVNLISKMDVHVVVSISGGDKNSKQKTKTTTDHNGGANPVWRFPMTFMVEEAALLQNRLMLDFKLKSERALGDRVIGEVHVPITDLIGFPAKGDAGERKFVCYQVKKPNGKPKGQLTFSYRFREKAATSASSAPMQKVHGESMAEYPVLEPSSPYQAAAFGGYPPLQSNPVSVLPEDPCGDKYLPPRGYFPACGPPPAWYPPPPVTAPGYMYPPQMGVGYPPSPLMQLAPDWWIVDWRCNFRCS